MGQYLSMPDPCPHITRMEVIAARLHGDPLPGIDAPCPSCSQPDAVEAPLTHTCSITRDRPSTFCSMPLFRLRCTCGWANAAPDRRDARDLRNDHLAHPGGRSLTVPPMTRMMHP